VKIMRRREVITLIGGAATWPLAAQAQQPERTRRIGVLMNQVDDDDARARLSAFRQELQRLGWSEGHNVQIDYRFGAAKSEQYLLLAKELIALQPDVILAQSTPVTATFQQLTRTIPIVFAFVSDPIGAGFVANLARPAGNITGTLLYEAGIMGKWLALLKEIAPRLTGAGLIGNPKVLPFDYWVHAAQAAAPALGIEVAPAAIQNADEDIERVIASFASAPNKGLVVLPDSTTTAVTRRALIVTLTVQHHLPAVYPYRVFVEAGGLMSYGIDPIEAFRLPASYVDRILRGAKPSDLPVQAPTKYETVVNLKAAQAIGLEVPASLLVRADEVIE
jgi:putative ABC transport system substrate-binding protein